MLNGDDWNYFFDKLLIIIAKKGIDKLQ